MMEVDEPRSTVNEIFGYRRIEWKISNYFAGRHYFANSDVNDWMQSPVFCVYSPFLTKWELGLMPSRRRYDMVRIYLKRVDNDPNRRFVTANWKCLFPTAEHYDREIERTATFQTSGTLITVIHRFSEFERSILERSFYFTVKCYIMVYGNDDSNALLSYGGGCLKSLSQDLAALGLYEKQTDTKLYWGSPDTVNVHSAILCCRNNVFNNIIKGRSVVDMNFPFEYQEELEKLIQFLYSGNLNYVLRVPSFAIEKAIEYFNVEELKEYFAYDELSVETRFFEYGKQYKWIVYNLDRITRGCIWSHRFKGFDREVFRLVLYPRGISGREDYMSVKIRLLKGMQPRHFCVYFGVYDINNVTQDVRCRRWPPYEVGSIILNNIILADRDNLNNVFYDTRGKIKFFCKFQKLIDQSIGPPDERYPVINKINKFKHYEKLSEDMTFLYRECTNGDLLVGIGGSNIVHKVHKMVLCSRSYQLSRLLLIGQRRKICLQNVEPEVVDVTFHYIYTGVLKVKEPETVLKVFRFGNDLGIQGLKNACARMLETDLRFGNAIEILIAAHELKDRRLESATLKFIRYNAYEVSSQKYWRTLIDIYPKLYINVIEFLYSTDKDQMELEDIEISQIC